MGELYKIVTPSLCILWYPCFFTLDIARLTWGCISQISVMLKSVKRVLWTRISLLLVITDVKMVGRGLCCHDNPLQVL